MTYDPSIRCAPCPDEDACEILSIEFSAAIPVYMTGDQQQKLHKLLDEIVYSPWNQPKDGVHWVSGYGSKPHWSRADRRFLRSTGVPLHQISPFDEDTPETGEPEFDDSVMFIETCAREFLSNEERERKNKRPERMVMYTPRHEDLKRLANDFTYHAPHGNQADRYGVIRSEAGELAHRLLTLCPPSRELSLALTHIEEAVFYANASIARNEKDAE